MGGVVLGDTTSLSRLKALGSLSSLDDQLQEAQKLCNHSARAEMLLRWLVARMKTSSETRKHSGSWKLLASCLRLLSPQKTAATLGSGTLHEVLQKTCAEESLSMEILSAVSRAWELLFEMSQAPTGVAITALLRVDGVVGAEICGDWLQHVYRAFQLVAPARCYTEDELSLLSFGLQLWTGRKRSSFDDAYFSSKSVLPACQLVALLGKNDGLDELKRKRSNLVLTTTKGYLRSLESLIAKHTVLPARTKFLATREKEFGRKQSSKIEQAVGLFDVLKTTTRDVFEVVPVFLDIALRAVSTPTPGQRSREIPWFESMFGSLAELLNRDQPDQYDETIAAMLHRLSDHRATLSSKMLSELADDALAATETPGGASWQTISQITLLNPGILTSSATAIKLFTAIGTKQMSETQDDLNLLKDRIMVPVIDAFVQKQQTKELLDLWHLQLASSAEGRQPDIWISIVPDIVDALTSLLGNDVALSALMHFSALFKQLAASNKRTVAQDDTQRQLGADLVLLRAVLQGLRNNSLVYQHLDELQDALVSLDATYLSADCRRNLWQLFSTLFELWAPSWIAKQADETSIASALTKLTKSNLFTTAMKDAQANSSSSSAAQVLLACVYDVVQRYETKAQSKALRTQIVNILRTQPADGLSILAEYPILPDRLKSADRISSAAVSLQTNDEQPDVARVVSPSRTQILERLMSDAQDNKRNEELLYLQRFSQSDTLPDLKEAAARISTLSAKVARDVLFCFEESLGAKVDSDTIVSITSSATPDSRARAQLQASMIKNFWANSAQAPSKYLTNDIWDFLLRALSERQDNGVRSEILKLIETLFAQRKHAINQYGLERTLAVMREVIIRNHQTIEVFSGVCQVLRVILNQYRTQLQGRFHLVTVLLQTLITNLIDDSSASPVHFRARHARSVAQILEIFCKPVWVRSTATNLVDSSREAQKYAGQFVQYILHHYCSQVLASNPAEGIRVAIRPGIFAMCEAMEAHDEARVRSLSAAMNANERAILRIVVNDWRAFGKWEGK